jgi:O-acetyl-ADP-ribose deacetylase (regulator of RNase III)
VIRVVRSDPERVRAQAIMRSVGGDLEACSNVDKRLGIRAGAEVLDRLRAFGDLAVGGAMVTPGGGLDCELLIHVVIRSGEEPVSEDRVGRAFRNGLRQAAEWEVGVLAVPPLGIGAGNLDAETSARIMVSVAADHRREHASPSEILILAGSDYEEEVFRGEAERVLTAGTT